MMMIGTWLCSFGEERKEEKVRENLRVERSKVGWRGIYRERENEGKWGLEEN